MIKWPDVSVTSPLQRTVDGYEYEQEGHVYSLCLHRRTVEQRMQEEEDHVKYERKIRGAGKGMIRRRTSRSLALWSLTCRGCHAVAFGLPGSVLVLPGPSWSISSGHSPHGVGGGGPP